MGNHKAQPGQPEIPGHKSDMDWGFVARWTTIGAAVLVAGVYSIPGITQYGTSAPAHAFHDLEHFIIGDVSGPDQNGVLKHGNSDSLQQAPPLAVVSSSHFDVSTLPNFN